MSTECSEQVGQICERMRAVREENERLLAANRYSLDMFNMINADYQKARAENDRYRAEIDRLTVANANYEINVSAMWADYKCAVADRERYRAALVEITNHATMLKTDPDHPELYWLGIAYLVGEIASRTLAIRIESGPLSDDSGPIAESGK